MGIDLSFLSGVVSELNYFFTNLARSEQMKDIDMRSKTSKMATDEDVASTTVSVEYADGQVSLSINTNENNTSSVWKNNFMIMAKSLLSSKIQELIYFYKEEIYGQIRPYIINSLGGVFT